MAIGGYPTAFKLGDTQSVSVGASSTQSTALDNNMCYYRVISSCDTHIQIGENPTATTGSTLLPAYTTEYFFIPESMKIAVLKFGSQTGTCYISDCTR